MDPGWDPMFIAYLWIACQTSCPAHSTWFWGIQPRATALKAKCKQMWLNKLDLKLLWVSHRSRKLPGKIVLNLIIWKAGPPFKFSNVIRFWYRKLNHSYGRSSNKYSSQFPKYPINTKELNRKRYLLVSRNQNQATAIRTVRCCLSHPLEMMEEIRCFGLHSLSASINFHQCRGRLKGLTYRIEQSIFVITTGLPHYKTLQTSWEDIVSLKGERQRVFIRDEDLSCRIKYKWLR